MCIVVAKYFKDIGWTGIKNRDRNYIPEISFKQKINNGVETLLFWDDITQYNEGMNSGGVCILSASLMTLDDEKEITVRSTTPSKDGAKIKKALTFPNVKAAAMSLIKSKLPGNTLIFDKDTCYLLEGAWKDGGYADREYRYKIREIPHDETIARTNHGIWLEGTGYQRNPDNVAETLSRVSSESRLAIAEHVVANAKTPDDIIDGLAKTWVNEPQLNCLRTAHNKKQMRTTSQIMLIPSEHTMFVRPVQSNLTFNFWQMNDPKKELWIEILGNRVLYKHKEENGTLPFPKMSHKSE
jgi:hypothetical protein